MRKDYPVEFVFQLTSLVVAAIVVHAVWSVEVRPRANAILAEQAAQMRAERDYVPERSLYVLFRDYEQESEVILFLWALAIMGYKGVLSRRERRLLDSELVPRSAGTRILPEDAREYARQVQALPVPEQRLLLPRALLGALNRFAATGSIAEVSETGRAVCQAEADRLDSELAMVRYIAWAIPAIGFIGTVRGIGDALGQAHRALDGDVSGVTEGLGVAFNSTLVALLISIVLMFLLHQLQLTQERLVLDTEHYLDEHLVQHLRVP
jgi:biopolymer transport protein ExbB/TolQ